nr:small VCP/p97-interacting protein [Columba livia]
MSVQKDTPCSKSQSCGGSPRPGAWHRVPSLCCVPALSLALVWRVCDIIEAKEIKRRQLAEAAEKRQMEASSRGIKNVYSVEQKKKKQEEIEKRMAASGSGGEGGLRWQVG